MSKEYYSAAMPKSQELQMPGDPVYASQPVRPEVLDVLRKLTPGARIRIRQLVRVGFKSWPVEVTGTFRHLDSLATGLATDRVAADDIIVPIVHFTKDNKEMSSIAIDEHTKIEIIG